MEDLDKWRKQGGTIAAIMKDDAGGKDGWWLLLYNPDSGQFSFSDKVNIEIRDPGECYLCDKRRQEIEDRNEIVGEDGKSVRTTLTRLSDFRFQLSPVLYLCQEALPSS